MTTETFSLSRTADRIATAAALLFASLIAAPIILLAVAPFVG